MMAKMLFAITLLLLYAFTATTASSATICITVDQSGKGDYSKIQDAIDAVPSKNTGLVSIRVQPGVYKERVFVPANKPFITLSGSGTPDETVITWYQSGPINETATFFVSASDFIGRNLTIQNTYGVGDMAVALRVSGDRIAFYGCRILSHQDALFDDIGKHYYTNSYIEGDTDFIFGSALSLFENCHLHSLSELNGAITAQRRGSPSEQSGFTFLKCRITGVKTALLGRPWGPYSTVVFAYTEMSNVILPQGWDDWGLPPSNLSKVYFGEYNCFGAGAVTSKRVNWARALTTKEFEPFGTHASFLRFRSSQGPGAEETAAPPAPLRGGGGGGGRHKDSITLVGGAVQHKAPPATPIGGGGQYSTPPTAVGGDDILSVWDYDEWSGCPVGVAAPSWIMYLSFFIFLFIFL